MTLLDLVIPRIRISNMALVAVGLVLIIAAIIMIYPNAASAFESASNIFRHIIAAASGLIGIYIIYHTLQTRNKIDDIIGLAAGFVMLGISTYLELGRFVAIFPQITDFLTRTTPYIVAASLALTGAMIASKSRHSTIIALFFIIAALAILGVSLTNVFGW